MILALTLEAEYHWGYWVRVPFSSKFQASLPLPPPTTLLGALANGLIKDGFLRGPDGGKLVGEIFLVSMKKGRRKIDFRSPASVLDDALITASAALAKGRTAFIIEDINKYVTLLLQQKVKEDVNGRKIPRRYLPKYRTGAIYCGKVYYPSGPIEVVYLFEFTELEKIVDGNPAHAIERAAWRISRIGSKESLVSIKKVSCMEFNESDINKGKVETRFYFPSKAGDVIEGTSYIEVFWRRGWGRHDPPAFEEYVIPGSRNPVSTNEITVDAEAYIELGDDITLVFPAPGK